MTFIGKVQAFFVKRKLLWQLFALLFTAVLVILAVVTYFHNSLGWFANNRTVTADGMAVRVENADAQAAYVSYAYNARSGELIVNDGASSDPNFIHVSGDNGNLEVMPFDMIFKSRNRYTPAIVKIHLSDIKAEYRSRGTVTVTLDRGVSGLRNANTLGDYATSVMRFFLVTGNVHDNTVLSGVSDKRLVPLASNDKLPDIFEAVYNYTDGSPLPSPNAVFTTFTGTDPSYTYTEASDISLSVDYASTDVVDGEMDLYLYIAYDETLVSHKIITGISGNTSVIGQTDDILDNIAGLTVSFNG